MKKPKRSKKSTKSPKRSKVGANLAKKTKVASPATESTAKPVTRSKAARTNIAEGTRLFALAGRPTKQEFIKVYGPKGPKMTWAERANAGVDSKHFREALRAKS